MYGGIGDDTYVVEDSNNTIYESEEEGNDVVEAHITYSLDGIDNIEDLTLKGTENIDGTGNSLDNTLTGNSGDNTLSGLSLIHI